VLHNHNQIYDCIICCIFFLGMLYILVFSERRSISCEIAGPEDFVIDFMEVLAFHSVG